MRKEKADCDNKLAMYTKTVGMGSRKHHENIGRLLFSFIAGVHDTNRHAHRRMFPPVQARNHAGTLYW
jgi:hypothetical protein